MICKISHHFVGCVCVLFTSAHTQEKCLRDVNSLYVISYSEADGWRPRLPTGINIGKEREEDGYSGSVKASNETPEFGG